MSKHNFSKFWNYGLSKEDYKRITPKINEDSWRMDKIISFLGAAIMTLLFIVSFFFDKLKNYIPVYGAFAGIFLLCAIIIILLKNKNKLGRPGMYLLLTAYFAFGMTLSLYYPDEKAAVIHMEFILLPMIFADKPLRVWIYSLLIALTYIILVLLLKNPSVRFEESFNAISFTILSLATHWILGETRCKGFLASLNSEEMLEENSKIILELEATKKELQIESDTDALTGLKNRRSLYEEFASIEKGTSPRPEGLLMIDIDHFKLINDTKGHLIGDHYLSSLGRFLLEAEEDKKIKAYRYGGEEFIILVYNGNKPIEDVAEEVRKETSELSLEDNGHITISVGYAEKSSEKDNPMESWLDDADKGVYLSKEAGRNCVRKYLSIK